MICLLSSLRRETRAAPAGASVAVQLGFEAANAGEPLILRVRGDCMTPLLRDGQTVAVNPTAVVWPGDVVAFLGADGRLRVHRLLLSLPTPAGWLWLTKPDRADWIDAPTQRHSGLGRVHCGSWKERVEALVQVSRLAARSIGRRLRRSSR